MDLWVQIVACCSASWAIYCLVTLYIALTEDLERVTVNPLGKFLVIKGVVFWCFFQSIILKVSYSPALLLSRTYARMTSMQSCCLTFVAFNNNAYCQVALDSLLSMICMLHAAICLELGSDGC